MAAASTPNRVTVAVCSALGLALAGALLLAGVVDSGVEPAPAPQAIASPPRQAAPGSVQAAAPERIEVVDAPALRLQSGETATVDLHVRSGVGVTVAVHGPSATLLSQLDVLLRFEAANGAFPSDRDSPRSQLDGDGRARFLVTPGRCQAMLLVDGRAQALRAVDGSALVQTLADGVVIEVEPVEPLAGVVVRERGKAVPSALSRSGPIERGAKLGDCHVMLAADLAAAPRLWFWSAALGARSCAQDELQREGDVAFADAERGGALARLTVLAEIPAEYHRALRIVAEPLQGGKALRIGSERSPFAALLPAGEFRLRWSCNGVPGAVIDERLTLAPGEERELRAVPPLLQPWTGRIADLAVLASPAVFASVLVDGQWALGGASADGTLPFVLPEPPRADMAAEVNLHALKMRLPARITSIDLASHTFVVEHSLTAADIVHVDSRGLGGGERSIRLCSAIPETRFSNDLGPGPDVPMPPAGDRWFTLHHGTQQQVLQPAGHWATVRLMPQGVKAAILIEGVAGMDPIQVGELAAAGECRIFVADGTRAVHVDLVPRQRVSFAPESAEMVVR